MALLLPGKRDSESDSDQGDSELGESDRMVIGGLKTESFRTPYAAYQQFEDDDQSRQSEDGEASLPGPTLMSTETTSPDSLLPLPPPPGNPEHETSENHTKRTGRWITFRDVRDWWFADGPTVLVYLIWVAGMAAIATDAAVVYWNNPNYYVTVARICGAILKLNCALILLPVLRNILTYLRKVQILHVFIPFDKNIAWHRHIGWTLLIFGLGHACAHYLNYNTTGTSWQLAWGSLAGWTGHVISMIMIFMYATAWRDVRRRWYNQFWFTHHLFIAFFALMLAHAPKFWPYFLGPGVVYTLERLIREFRGRKMATKVTAVKLHPSNVIEVRMKKKRFSYMPGQYLFLACPQISHFEWHPFTITSAPEEEFVSVHIRCVGDWTNKFAKILAPEGSERRKSLVVNQELDSKGRALVKLDGPFGAASEDVFRFRVVILVGGGIGVTPFASILKSIRYRLESRKGMGKLEKVYFFWTSRDQSAFEWFRALLADLEDQLASLNLSDLIVINIYLTGQLKIDEIKKITAIDISADDPITKLKSKTSFGRPRFDVIFERVRDAHRHTKVGVFFCGPKPLGAALETYCKEYSQDYDTYHTRFVWRREIF